MMAQNRFCVHCGAPLPAGARFCASCGQPAGAAPAPPPASPAGQQVVYQIGPAQPLPQGYVQPQSQSMRPRIRLSTGSTLLLVVGVLLVLLLLARFLALKVVGETTIATVTAVEQTDSTDYQYQVSYTFVGPDGATVRGSATLDNVLNVGTLPNVGEEVTVRYLPFWPAINEMGR